MTGARMLLCHTGSLTLLVSTLDDVKMLLGVVDIPQAQGTEEERRYWGGGRERKKGGEGKREQTNKQRVKIQTLLTVHIEDPPVIGTS